MKGRQGTEPDQLYADSYLVVSRSAESSGLTISQPEGRCYSNCNRYVFTITNIITKYICDFHPVPSMYVSKIRSHPTALLIFLYYDDVEVCNPLGSSKGKHKLGNHKILMAKIILCVLTTTIRIRIIPFSCLFFLL